MRAVDIIMKKRDGGALSRQEIGFFISGVTAGTLPDYQASALLMAIVVRGMTAMKGTPISFAKYASETAVEPLDASITGWPGRIQPLHRP